MITGVDAGVALDFVSKYDNAEPKTIWKLSILSAYAYSRVSSKMTDAAKYLEGMIDVVRFGLSGFDNFKNKNGDIIKFDTQPYEISSQTYRVITNSIINQIPIDVIVELATKILDMTKLTEQEIKN